MCAFVHQRSQAEEVTFESLKKALGQSVWCLCNFGSVIHMYVIHYMNLFM